MPKYLTLLSFLGSKYRTPWGGPINGWPELLNSMIGATGPDEMPAADQYQSTLFTQYIFPRYALKPIAYQDGKDSNAIEVGYAIYAWLIRTTEKYEPLIKLYTENQNKLMSKLTSTTSSSGSNDSQTGFNDTPQNGGLWNDDKHTSTITLVSGNNRNDTTITSDSGTIMARLKEIRDNLESLYDTWSNEFGKEFVIYGVN